MAKSPKQPKKRNRIRSMSPAVLKRQLAKQEAVRRKQQKHRREKQQALAARDNYQASKKDRGQIVFIGVHGQRTARNKGRKGYLVYVTKTGKKWFIKQHYKRGEYQPKKFSEIQPSLGKNLHKKAATFQRSKLEKIAEGRSAIKGRGEVASGGAWDFSDKVVGTIARSIKKTIERQASHRIFNIKVNVLCALPDGNTDVLTFNVPIEKADHISISLDGLENFVTQKFYAFMAQELAFLGFVTAGSSNHVRRLSVNAGKDRSDWVKPYQDEKGKLRLMPWRGADMQTVTIKKIAWEIEQAKTK